MATHWCPTCRTEWWTGTDVCRDCGTELVDGQPPDPDEDRDHGVATLDLAELDEAARWRITLVLKMEGIEHRWSDGHLELPAAAVELVEEELAGVTAPDEDDVAPGEDDGAPADDDVARAPRPFAARLRGPAPTGPPRTARCVAFLLDSVVYGIAGGAFGVILVNYERGVDGELHRTSGSPWSGVGFLLLVLVHATATVATFGKTPGMALAGLEVRSDDGGRLGWWRSLLRAVLGIGWLGALPLVMMAGLDPRAWALEWAVAQLWAVLLLISILNDPDGRGLHDRLVGSVVRRTQTRPVEHQVMSG
jgi:uncharacterized RDD family membrane protein YckC